MLQAKLFTLFFVGFLAVFPVFSQEDEDYTEEEAIEDTRWVSKQMPFTRQNIQVPRAFWQAVKDTLKADGVAESIVNEFAILPVSVQVELTSEDHFVLKDGKNYRLVFVDGGGDLDLFEYVTGKGDFHLRFAPGFENDNKFHMFYISDSPGKKVGGDPWGNGCGKIFDLSDKATLFMLDSGMRLTSSRRHHMHLMAGTFVIFQLVEDRLYMGYIRVADSRYPQFNCQASQE